MSELMTRHEKDLTEEVKRLRLESKEQKTALAEAMFSADAAEARMEDLVREVEHMRDTYKSNVAMHEHRIETLWEPLLAAAKSVVTKHEDGGYRIMLDDWDLDALDALDVTIAACEEKT
jgi:hypothetical protein